MEPEFAALDGPDDRRHHRAQILGPPAGPRHPGTALCDRVRIAAIATRSSPRHPDDVIMRRERATSAGERRCRFVPPQRTNGLKISIRGREEVIPTITRNSRTGWASTPNIPCLAGAGGAHPAPATVAECHAGHGRDRRRWRQNRRSMSFIRIDWSILRLGLTAAHWVAGQIRKNNFA